jgi:predicted negative regulator of RcsB-dependent stress response
MELVILLVVVLGGIGWFIWSERQAEKNGSHPLDSVTKPNVLDVNKDGKVDIKDAVAAVEVVKEEVKTVAKKTATKAKKAAVEVETKVKTAVKKAKAPSKPKK